MLTRSKCCNLKGVILKLWSGAQGGHDDAGGVSGGLFQKRSLVPVECCKSALFFLSDQKGAEGYTDSQGRSKHFSTCFGKTMPGMS